MLIAERITDDRTVLVLTGRFLGDAGRGGAADLRGAMADLIGRHLDEVVLDVSGVPALDAAGLGEIVLAHTTLRRHGGRLHLLNPTKRVQRLLDISRVGTVIPVYDSIDQVPVAATSAA